MPNTSMMAFAFHPNEGTKERPRFGHALGYPVNLTETDPQPVEHTHAFAVCDRSQGHIALVCQPGERPLSS